MDLIDNNERINNQIGNKTWQKVKCNWNLQEMKWNQLMNNIGGFCKQAGNKKQNIVVIAAILLSLVKFPRSAGRQIRQSADAMYHIPVLQYGNVLFVTKYILTLKYTKCNFF